MVGEKTARMYPFLSMAAILAVTGCMTLEDPSSEAPEEDGVEDSDGEGTEAPVGAEEQTDESALEDEDLAAERPEGAVTTSEVFTSDDGTEELELTVTIDPIVREHVEQHDDEHDFLSLSMHFQAESDNEDFGWQVSQMLHNPAIGGTVDEVRLVDAEELLVHQPISAHDGENWLDVSRISNQGIASPGGDEVLWRGYFNTVEETSEELSVLLPYIGPVEGIPVISAEEAEEGTWASLEETVEDDWDLLRQIWDLEIYRENVFESYGSRYDGEETTLTVSGDLLFEFGEADLTDEAGEALEAASDEIDQIEGGELQIIGHTDDVSDEEFNQELSEQRAESVRDRLDELVDLDSFDEVTVEGRNFQEPVASNETEEGQAQNRRVELVYTPAETPLEEAVGEGSGLPETEGPEGEPGEPFEVTHSDGRTAQVTLESVEQVGNLLVGRITVEPDQLEEPDDLSWPLTFGGDPARTGHDELNTGSQADAPTLLVGDYRIFPLDYGGTRIDPEDTPDVEDGIPVRSPLADRDFGGRWEGTTTDGGTATVIWPAPAGVSTVTVDVPEATGNVTDRESEPWRVENVEVGSSE